MKNIINLVGALALMLGLALLVPGTITAQTCDGGGKNFVDLNGDGINDNAPDADGDGIPNGLDPDWIKNAQDGTGYQHRNGAAREGQTVEAASSLTLEQQQTMTMRWYRAMFQHCVKLAEPGDGVGLKSGFGAGPHSGETQGNGHNGNNGQGNGR
jgi:hypothetical protein